MTALLVCFLAVAPGGQSRLLDILAQELDRNFAALKQKADPAPYYLSYAVTGQDFQVISASLGALTARTGGRTRVLDVGIRVGSPQLDNYHRVRGERAQFTSGAAISIDDAPAAIRSRLWLDTDRAYRAAAERLIKIRTSTQVKVAEEDASADFSSAPPAVFSAPPARVPFDSELWAERARRLSARLARIPGVLRGNVTVIWQNETRYLASTEGTRLEHGRGFARVVITAQAKAPDGMDLGTGATFEAAEPGRLPTERALNQAADRVASDLAALLKAPVSEPFVGPAIFSGRAAAVFFHEIFGHRIEGHRQKDETEGQTFTKSVGTKVLPEFLSVVFDPTRRQEAGIDLNGWYAYDDEGVKAQPVTVIENGVLRTFLMSRSPVKGFPQSNGHGRRQPGLEPVSRQSNLIVESSRRVPEARLREMLIAEVKRQGKPYGLYFQDITGGFTATSRMGLQAFKVIPVMVYRVFPGGRPDELVRGADMVGTPLASFSKILATGEKPEVFNGYCGAESGNVPVAAVSPALLVSEIEIEKKAKSQERPPLLPPPGGEKR
ncbi:MAG: TldD/PmbA family protein [Bryobacteraceae bacterium]